MEPKWRQTDKSVVLPNCPDHEAIGLYYYRTYTPGGGFSHSPDNNAIFNFKKSPLASPAQLFHKQKAIEEFAQDLKNLLKHQKRPVLLTPMPTSKTESDSEYDDRLFLTVLLACKSSDLFRPFPLLTREQTIGSLHSSSKQRTTESASEHLRINPDVLKDYPSGVSIALVDDVLTTGGTFTACRNLIRQAIPGVNVVGIFWAHSSRQTAILDMSQAPDN